MIDFAIEPPLTLAQAARLVPPSRGDRPTRTSTLSRWITVGIGGVRLEANRLGGRWLTSAAALQRFSEAQTEVAAAPARRVATPAGKPNAPAKTPSRSAKEASRMLDVLWSRRGRQPN